MQWLMTHCIKIFYSTIVRISKKQESYVLKFAKTTENKKNAHIRRWRKTNDFVFVFLLYFMFSFLSTINFGGLENKNE